MAAALAIAAPPFAIAQQPKPDERKTADPVAGLQAVERAQEIQDKAVHINNSEGGVYSEKFEELVQEVVSFFKWGSGTEEEPSDEAVSEFCRHYVLGLMWELFFAGFQGTDAMPDGLVSSFQNPLDERSTDRLRDALVEMLPTAPDLPLDDRLWVWRLSKSVFRPQDSDALDALRSLASSEALSGTEQDHVRFVARWIKSRTMIEDEQ